MAGAERGRRGREAGSPATMWGAHPRVGAYGGGEKVGVARGGGAGLGRWRREKDGGERGVLDSWKVAGSYAEACRATTVRGRTAGIGRMGRDERLRYYSGKTRRGTRATRPGVAWLPVGCRATVFHVVPQHKTDNLWTDFSSK
jgi:hypothetical protein